MDKRLYLDPPPQQMSAPRRSLPQYQRPNTNNYMQASDRHSSSHASNMAGYGGQGVKRMRNDDRCHETVSSAHRMKWDTPDEDNNSAPFLERNDIDQRSEAFGQFNNITMNETSVLCLTVQNAKYPITLDVIRKICSIGGQIWRICILRKRALQVLIEFDSFETARKIKDELDGADIYSGCCTLKIDFANLKHLVVRGNDQDNLDLTVDDSRYGHRRTLLASPPRYDRFEPPMINNDGYAASSRFGSGSGAGFDRYSNQHMSSHGRSSSSSRDNSGGFPPLRQHMYDNNSHFYSQQRDSYDRQQRFPPYPDESDRFRDSSPHHSMRPDSFVFNVEGLSSSNWNCERLFNLLCVYGNVLRIKFLKSKEGGAMVQMNRCENLQQHMKSLSSTFIFGQTFIIVPSRQIEIQPLNRPFPLENGDASYMEFETNRNNRYLTNEQAVKNRPVAPSHVLYYFNTPPSMTEVDIVKFFEDVGAKRPVKVKNFQPRKDAHHDRGRRGGTQPKGVTGLAEFRTTTDACECLILANNYPIPHQSSNWPFFFKLTFSATPITDEDALSGEEIDTSTATVTIESGREHQRQRANDESNRNRNSSNEHRRHRHSSPSA